MEQKLQNRYGRWGRALSFALALALAALLTLAALPLAGSAYAAEGDGTPVLPGEEDGLTALAANAAPDLAAGSCRLTVNFPLDNEWTLEEEDVLVDLYKIAGAAPVPGYNVYGYTLGGNAAVDAVIRSYITDEANREDWTVEGDTFRYTPKGADKNGWDALRDALVAEVIGKGTLQPLPVEGKVGEAIADLDPGLYIFVAHGDLEPEDYLVKTETGYGSIAYDDSNVYTFAPQLVSLPGLVGGGTDTTTNAGWSGSVDAVAKAGFEPRFASIEITKSLTAIPAGVRVPVVFEISGMGMDDTKQPTPVTLQVAFTFENSTEAQSRVISDFFLAGQPVTIREIYAAPGYELQPERVIENPTGGTITVTALDGSRKTLEAGQPVSESFVNTLTGGNIPSGGGYVSQFEVRDADGNSVWQWSNDGGATWQNVG